MDAKHERLLDLWLEGDITPEQFRARSTELKDAHVAVQDQLEAARSRLSRLKDVERSKEQACRTTPPSCRRDWPDSPRKRDRVCKTMRLRVYTRRDDTLIAEWGCNVSL